MTKPVVTRFAPSPTGYLHIGGARTALFNWLYARHTGGKFLLRIEDTDRERSTEPAIKAILDGLKWLELDWDGEPLFQFARAARHCEVAEELLASGRAYRCYLTPAELATMHEAIAAERALAKQEKRPPKEPQTIQSPWRDRDPTLAPAGVKPVLRLRAPRDGETALDDKVQGRVVVPNSQLDDMIILRSDGTPTYNFAVVVDDHDMGITHVIRGVDHLTNAARQVQIYKAKGWDVPVFAHVPLIHGPDGAKLSKRHGALGVDAYRDELGMLPEAVSNYLLRLGWGHGDDEIISRAQATEWFDLDHVGKSPSRFDFKKLENLNGHYIREADDGRLAELIAPGLGIDEPQQALLTRAMPELKARATTLHQLADGARFLFDTRPLAVDEAAAALLTDESRAILAAAHKHLVALAKWDVESLEAAIRDVADASGAKLGKIAQPLRAALTGRTTSPGIFDVLALLGRDESLARIADQMVD